jgi:hypothetical protein
MSPEARERSFDELARALASGELSRRKALRLMGAALVGGTLASLGIREAAADPPGCKRNGKHCKNDEQCCSRNCSGGKCAACPSGQELCNGSCVSNSCDPLLETFNPTTCRCEPAGPNRIFCQCQNAFLEACVTFSCGAELELQAFCNSHCASFGGTTGGRGCRTGGCLPPG